MMQLTHPDKILYPEKKITKADVVKYYHQAHKLMLPYLRNRLLSVVRCPEGWNQQCFYQKHVLEQHGEDIYTFDVNNNNKTRSYIYVKDEAGLLALVQMNVLEIHGWGCTIKNINKPDILVFDLDPAPEVTWNKVIDAAFLIKELLEKYGLASFVKLTGGKGLHVVVPIKPEHEWLNVKLFSHSVADYLAALHPDKYIANMNKEKRKGKIFIDYLRNALSATSIAPYSTRARENAPIAVPLQWDELSPKIKPNHFTLANINKRLQQNPDPWPDFFDLRQKLKLPV